MNHFPANLDVNIHTNHKVNGNVYLSFQEDLIIGLFVADIIEVISCLLFLNTFSTAKTENITGKN